MRPTADTLEMPTQRKEKFAEDLSEYISPGTIVRRSEPMSKHTTLRVGGPADFYVEPADEKDLAGVLKFCRERETKFFILGRGSNVLVRDGGFRGAAICLSQPHFGKIEIAGERIHCGAGARLKNVSVEAKRNDLSGVEFFEGIPGSVGGALRMNAGAMNGQTFDVVESVRIMNFDGNVSELRPAEMSVTYRSCDILKNHVALGAVFKCKKSSR
jgi:UDP-N-acetylenolpyruvoylglucosamine reductase